MPPYPAIMAFFSLLLVVEAVPIIIVNFGLNTTIFKVYHTGIIKFIKLIELRRIMKQVLISKGNVFVDEVPTLIVTDDTILVKTG